MEHFDLPPLGRVAGNVSLPGSKSISNRLLLLAALAEGTTELRDLLDSDDTRVMLSALAALGVGLEKTAAHAWRVRGVGGPFPVKQGDLFLGNAGTAFRPLTAALALSGGHYKLSGVPRMHERPIGDLVDGLRQIGCDVRYAANEGFPPLAILPAAVSLAAQLSSPLRVRGDVSSQFLTALLMALPLTGRPAVVEMTTELISKPYIEITLNLMARFGVTVQREDWRRFTIPGGQRYSSPGTVHVEGDASGASYFLAAGAIGGGTGRGEGVGRDSIPGDGKFADAPATIPDAAMTLAVAALFADGPCKLRNIASWRVKETDRIAAMATELRKLGATVEEGPDWLGVSPPLTFQANAAIDTYDDHRMAMCFSLAALGGVPVRINDPRCVTKTFPDYFERFGSIAAPVIAIDGPSASGKGTVAQRVATTLGYHFLDSGALYRLTALAAMRAGVALDDESAVAAVATALPATFEGERILLAGDDVTEAIRAEDVGVGASKVAVLPVVRWALLERQRAYRRFPGLVADGRDMGSVVFPGAPVKVFLTASAEARAQRRHKQLIEKGMAANIRTLLQDLQERDARDAARAVAPLRQEDDAALVDTTPMSIDEAVAAVLDIVRGRLPFIN